MKVNTLLAGAVFALGVSATGSAWAQDNGLGEAIYVERCAICHGMNGAGDGPVGELFADRPKDLTSLSANNNGMFPFSEVYQSVDGRRNITAHGNSEMPVWGEYFMQSAIDNPTINEKYARQITQGRILSVVYYLQSIQNN